MGLITDSSIINQLYSVYLYFSKYISNVTFFDFEKIFLVDNINEDLKKFGFISDTQIQGGAIIPLYTDEEFKIVIDVLNKNPIDNAKALLHELQHISDFEAYIAHYSNKNNHDIIKQLPYFHSYNMYSEFCASFSGEFYSIKWFSEIYKTDGESYIKEYFDNLLIEYVNKKIIQFHTKKFRDYDLSQLLGKFLISDTYHNIHELENSCIFQFVPLIFDTGRSELVYQLYQIYHNGLIHKNIFENLTVVEIILSQMNYK